MGCHETRTECAANVQKNHSQIGIGGSETVTRNRFEAHGDLLERLVRPLDRTLSWKPSVGLRTGQLEQRLDAQPGGGVGVEQ